MKKLTAVVLALMLLCGGCGLIPSPTAEPTRTHKKTASPTPELTATPTETPTPEPSASPTPEPTVTFTLAPTASPKPSPTPEPTPEPSPTPEPTERPTLPPPKAEFGQKVYYMWKDDAGDINIHIACEVKNTGACAIEPDITVTVYDKNGEEIDTIDFPDVYPSVILPGKTGYMGTTEYLDVDNAADVAKVEASFSYRATYSTCTYYEASGLKLSPPPQGETASTITGVIRNNTQEDADDAMVACALYDGSGKLLGVIGDWINPVIDAGKEEPFELSEDLSPDVLSKVAKIVCVAYETD